MRFIRRADFCFNVHAAVFLIPFLIAACTGLQKPQFYAEIVKHLNTLHTSKYNASTFNCSSVVVHNGTGNMSQPRGYVHGLVSSLRWSNFRVHVDPVFSAKQYKLISDTMAHLEAALTGCKITFDLYERGAALPNLSEDFVQIVNGDTCVSSVGMQGGRQKIVLSTKSCMHSHIVLHNLLHALGFLHEHNRPDRDDHVTVNWDNINPDSVIQFYKANPKYYDTYGIPYDIHSVMHFHSLVGSRNGLPTITGKDGSQTGTWAGNMQRGDKERLKRLYC